MALRRFGLDSEYKRLGVVLLHKPGPEIGGHPEPSAIHHLQPIDAAALSQEFDSVISAFTTFGVEVVLMDPAPLGDDMSYVYNLMYCRDLLFMTPEGAILSSMAHPVRREEVRYAARTLEKNGFPVVGTISGGESFEGADALWLDERLVAVGVGHRTSRGAYTQMQDILRRMDVDCLALPCGRRVTQHLLGSVQIVDKRLALVRVEIAGRETLRLLEAHRFKIIPLPESNEVRTKQAMNIVTVAPRHIIMAAGCPETRELYINAGLTVVAELSVPQLIHGAGGLACATGILSRG